MSLIGRDVAMRFARVCPAANGLVLDVGVAADSARLPLVHLCKERCELTALLVDAFIGARVGVGGGARGSWQG